MDLIWVILAAFVAAVTGWLINYFKHPTWFTVGRALAATLVVVLLGSLIAIMMDSEDKESKGAVSAAERRDGEERIVEKFDPGQTFESLRQQLGAQPPDRLSKMSSGFIAQFNRDWGYVTTVVDADGNTDSIGIIRTDGEFSPSNVGTHRVPFGSAITEFEKEVTITGLMGFCGAHRSTYVEISDTDHVDAAHKFQSVAFGNLNDGPIDCAAESAIECYPDGPVKSFDFAKCLKTSGWESPEGLKLRESTPIWAVVVSAPDHHLTLDMLSLPNEIGG